MTTRAEALAAGLPTYHGAPCVKCGGTVRYIKAQYCKSCKQANEPARGTRVRPSRAKSKEIQVTKPGELWHLLVIPPDGPPELLISGATGKPIEIEFGREFAEQLAQENTARLATSGFRFEARVGLTRMNDDGYRA